MIKFWHKLVLEGSNKLSGCFLSTLNEYFNLNIFKWDWLLKIKNILDSNGLSYVWTFPTSVSTEWLVKKVTNNLKDMFLQTWLQQCRETNKACNYHLYKREFKLEIYLDNLPKCHRVFLTKIRTSNHKLPIEKGRYLN